MKRGEKEAKQILESYGIEFDSRYCDDNSRQSMPDLKYMDGRYLEVTHTNHNLSDEPTKYWFQGTQKCLEIEEQVAEARRRIWENDYPHKDCFTLTEEGEKLHKRDRELITQHYGTADNSEFGVDIITRKYSADNILAEACHDKAKKYPDGSVDLFIFVAKEEMKSVFFLLKSKEYNGVSKRFLSSLYRCPFPKIYLCVWNLTRREYTLKNATLLLFYKSQDVIKWSVPWHGEQL